ncbi:hypothetical protein N7490_000018 [Penicillium lividum]|nr:hypothetical protein N7490_000018 [Penicillium lividum]
MNTIAVLGATGQQGNSVVQALLKNGTWKIRGITRNTESEAARKLVEQGCDVVAADSNDEASLLKAFQGVTVVFCLTNYWEPLLELGRTKSGELEQKQLINIANAAAKTSTLQHYIFSSLPHAAEISKGQLKVPHFDFKAEVEDYIKQKLPELAEKTTYLWCGWYASNMAGGMKPLEMPGTGKFLWLQPSRAGGVLPISGHTAVNTGLAVEAIVSQPSLTRRGKYVPLVTEYLSFEEVLKVWEKVTGRAAVYCEASDDVTEALWNVYGAELASQFRFSEQFPDWNNFKPKNEVVTLEQLGIRDKVIGLEGTLESLKSSLI